MEINKRLVMTFKTTDDKSVSLSIDDPREDITETEIKTAMELVVSKNIFAPGGSDIAKAVAAPIIAATSGELSCSTQRTVPTTTTSFLKSFGNNGRNGLSIALDVKIALSVGFPSLFRNPPGIFPTAYNFSSKSTDNGKKSIPSLGSLDAVTFTNTQVSP